MERWHVTGSGGDRYTRRCTLYRANVSRSVSENRLVLQLPQFFRRTNEQARLTSSRADVPVDRLAAAAWFRAIVELCRFGLTVS